MVRKSWHDHKITKKKGTVIGSCRIKGFVKSGVMIPELPIEKNETHFNKHDFKKYCQFLNVESVY